MADILRWIENHDSKKENDQLILEIIEYLENEYGQEEYVDNLIAVSFLENLPGPGEAGARIRYELGPKLTRQLKIIWSSDEALD